MFNNYSIIPKLSEPQDIRRKTLIKKMQIKEKTCTFILKDVFFADINNNEEQMDKILINKMVDDLSKVLHNNSSKYNPLPKTVIISQEEAEEQSFEESKELGKDVFLECYEPRVSIDDVYLEEGMKKQIVSALTIAKHKDKLFLEWGLKSNTNNGRAVVLNFYGPPGTGKSMMAEGIAHYLGQNVYRINYSELESKYVGETPKNIKKAFDRAKQDNAVLIFDEADSFLGKRLTNVSQSADYGVNITRSVMLLEIEKFEGVVIFTTNMIGNYDEAFRRRILANVEFKVPDEMGRAAIWKSNLPSELPLHVEITPNALARNYDGLTGADIKDITLFAAVLCIQSGRQSLVIDDFNGAYQFIKNRYNINEPIVVKTEQITSEQYEQEMAEIREKESSSE